MKLIWAGCLRLPLTTAAIDPANARVGFAHHSAEGEAGGGWAAVTVRGTKYLAGKNPRVAL